MAVVPVAPVPDEPTQVRRAVRLGWAIAELRGRNRPDLDVAARTGRPVLHLGRALPLGPERTPAEQAIEAEVAARGLAEVLKLDFPLAELSDQPADPAATAGVRVRELARGLAAAATAEERRAAWEEFTEFLFTWDARMQDRLAAVSLNQAAAYQLGRGLAEVFWALEPDAADQDPRSWAFLLGSDRRATLARLAGQLASFFSPLTGPVVSASLAAWGLVAASPSWRTGADAVVRLWEQSVTWRDLVAGGRDPETLLAPHAVVRNVGSIWPVVKAFWPQLALAAAGVILLVAAAGIIGGQGAGSIGAILAVLGFFGVSAAGLQAVTKDSTYQLLAQIRLALYTQLIADAATVLPDHPPGPRPPIWPRDTSHHL